MIRFSPDSIAKTNEQTAMATISIVYCLDKESVIIRYSYKRPTLQSKQWWVREWCNRIESIGIGYLKNHLTLLIPVEEAYFRSHQLKNLEEEPFLLPPPSGIFSHWSWGPPPGLPEEPKNLLVPVALIGVCYIGVDWEGREDSNPQTGSNIGF